MRLFELHAGVRIFTASRQPGPLSGEAPNSLRERTTFVGAVTSCHSNNTGDSRALDVYHRYGSSTSTAGHEGEEYLPDQRSEGTLQASTHHNHKLFSRVAPPQQQQQRQQNNLEQRETVAQNHNSQRFRDIALMNKKTGEKEGSFQSSNLRLEFPVHYVAM